MLLLLLDLHPFPDHILIFTHFLEYNKFFHADGTLSLVFFYQLFGCWFLLILISQLERHSVLEDFLDHSEKKIHHCVYFNVSGYHHPYLSCLFTAITHLGRDCICVIHHFFPPTCHIAGAQ